MGRIRALDCAAFHARPDQGIDRPRAAPDHHLGNTIPSLASSFIRTTLLVVPAITMSHATGFALRWIWLLAVGCTAFHALLNYLLLQREYRRRLTFAAPGGAERAGPPPLAAAE
jgi:hypothetical protein